MKEIRKPAISSLIRENLLQLRISERERAQALATLDRAEAAAEFISGVWLRLQKLFARPTLKHDSGM